MILCEPNMMEESRKKVGWETSIVSSNLIQAREMLIPGCITRSGEEPCLRHKISRRVHVDPQVLAPVRLSSSPEIPVNPVNIS